MVSSHSFTIDTAGFTDVIDISPQVYKAIAESGISNANVVVACPSSTSGISTIEYEDGCIGDLRDFFERVAPMNAEYKHNLRWGDGNGYAHVRSTLIGPSLAFPLIEDRPVLGTWQQIIFIDFDNKPRSRTIYVQIAG